MLIVDGAANLSRMGHAINAAGALVESRSATCDREQVSVAGGSKAAANDPRRANKDEPRSRAAGPIRRLRARLCGRYRSPLRNG